jgi:hypothetical protein
VETSVTPLTWQQVRDLFLTYNRASETVITPGFGGGRISHRLDDHPNPQILKEVVEHTASFQPISPGTGFAGRRQQVRRVTEGGNQQAVTFALVTTKLSTALSSVKPNLLEGPVIRVAKVVLPEEVDIPLGRLLITGLSLIRQQLFVPTTEVRPSLLQPEQVQEPNVCDGTPLGEAVREISRLT